MSVVGRDIYTGLYGVVQRLAELRRRAGYGVRGLDRVCEQGDGDDHQQHKHTVPAVHAVIYSGLYCGGVSFYMPHCDAAV